MKLQNLRINRTELGKVYSFVDFGNVNYWYEKDERDCDENLLLQGEKLVVSLEKLGNFAHSFSDRSRFYFGFEAQSAKSIGFLDKSRDFFDNTITKPIQNIKHYVAEEELKSNTRKINKDKEGSFIRIPKCNFDVEICVDAIRLLRNYDTFCLFSSDSDFARLIFYLRKQNKKIILVKGGLIQHSLKEAVGNGLFVNAQDIKSLITFKKQKSRFDSETCGSQSRIHGQGNLSITP